MKKSNNSKLNNFRSHLTFFTSLLFSFLRFSFLFFPPLFLSSLFFFSYLIFSFLFFSSFSFLFFFFLLYSSFSFLFFSSPSFLTLTQKRPFSCSCSPNIWQEQKNIFFRLQLFPIRYILLN